MIDAANETMPRVCAPEAGVLAYRSRSFADEGFNFERTRFDSFDQARLPGTGQGGQGRKWDDAFSTPGLWDDLPGQSVAALLAAWAVDKWTATSAFNRQLIASMDSEGDALAVGAMAPEQMVRFHVARAIGRVAREQEMCLYGKKCDEKDGKGDGMLSRVGARVAGWKDAVVLGSQKIVTGRREMEERPGSERATMEEGRIKGEGMAAGAGGTGEGGTGKDAASLFVTPAAIRSWSRALLNSASPPSSAFQQRNSDVTVAALHALRTLADISDDVARISNDVSRSEPSLREGIALEALPQLRRVLAASTTAATHAASASGSAPASASTSNSASGVSTKRRDSDVPSARAAPPGSVRGGKSKERRESEGSSVEEREEAEEKELVDLAVGQAVASLVLGRRVYEAAAVGRLIGAAAGGPSGDAAAPSASPSPSSLSPAQVCTTPSRPAVVMPVHELRAWGPVLVRWACGVMGGGGESKAGERGGAEEGKGGGAAGKRGTGGEAAGLLGGRKGPAGSFLESNLVPSAAVAATAAAGQAVLVEVLSAAVHMAHSASDSSRSAAAAVDARGGDMAWGGKDRGGKGERGRANVGKEKEIGKGGMAAWRNGQVGRGAEIVGKQADGAVEGRQEGVEDVEGGEVGSYKLGKEWTDVAVGVGLLWLSEMLVCAVRDGEAARQAVKNGRAGVGSGEAGGPGRKGEAGRQGGGKGAESVGMTVATMKYLESLWRGGKGANGQGSPASPADQPSWVHPSGKAPRNQALPGGDARGGNFPRKQSPDERLHGGAGGASAGESAGEKSSWWSYVNPWGGSGVAGAAGQAAGVGSGNVQQGRERGVKGRAEQASGAVSGEARGELGGALSEKHRAVRDEALRSASTAVVRLGEALGSEAWGWGGGDGRRGGGGERKSGGGEVQGGMGSAVGEGGREEREVEGPVRVGVKGALGERGGEESLPVVNDAGNGSSRSSQAAAAGGGGAASDATGRKKADATVKVTVDELVKAAEEEHEHLMDLLGFEGGLYSTRSGLVASNEDKPVASDGPPRVNVVEALDAAAAAVKALAELASEDWQMQEQLVAGGGVELMRRLLIGREYWEWVRGEEEVRRRDENGAMRGLGAKEGQSQLDRGSRQHSSERSQGSTNTSAGGESSSSESAGSECGKKELLIGLAASAPAAAIATARPNTPPGTQPILKRDTRPTASQSGRATSAAATAGATAVVPARTAAAPVDAAGEEGLESARGKLTKLQRNAARLLAQLSAHPDSWAAIARDPLLIGWLEQCTTGGAHEDAGDRRGRGSERASEKGSERKRKTEESRRGGARDDTAHLHHVLSTPHGMRSSEQSDSESEEYDQLLCEACVSKKMRSNARKVLSHAAPALHALPGPASVAATSAASTSASGWQECDVAVPGWHEPGKQFTPRYDDGIFFVNPTSPWLQSHSLPTRLSSTSLSSTPPLSSSSFSSSSVSSSACPASSSTSSSVTQPPAPVLDVVFVHGMRGGPFKSWRRGEAVPAVAPPPGAAVAPVTKTLTAGTPVPVATSVSGTLVEKAPVMSGRGEERRVEGMAGEGMRESGVVRVNEVVGEDERAGEKVRQRGAEIERVMGGEVRRAAVGLGGERGGGKEEGKSVGEMEGILGRGESVGEVEPSKLLEATLKEEEEGGKKGSCWPCDWLARDLPEARILTTKYKVCYFFPFCPLLLDRLPGLSQLRSGDTKKCNWHVQAIGHCDEVEGERIWTSHCSDATNDISILLLHKLVAAGVGERSVVSHFAAAQAGGGRSGQESRGDISILLLHKLVAAGVGERPVVFVTHSMGGLIVKQMLALARASDMPEVRALAERTTAIVFYSVPHFGSRIADYSWRARAVLRPAPSGKIQVLSFAEVCGLEEGMV
ncbi:unnamed protein product [Closterium sp. Naga37s-1]|nr:unnamed protein product [Closterium sp. Naga37s-1]